MTVVLSKRKSIPCIAVSQIYKLSERSFVDVFANNILSDPRMVLPSDYLYSKKEKLNLRCDDYPNGLLDEYMSLYQTSHPEKSPALTQALKIAHVRKKMIVKLLNRYRIILQKNSPFS